MSEHPDHKSPKHITETERFRRIAQRLGARVRALREARGWTLEEASERMNMDAKHLWKMENAWGRSNATLATLLRIADGLDETIETLFRHAIDLQQITDTPFVAEENLDDSSPYGLIASAPLEERYQNYVPLFDLRAAAGSFGAVQVVEAVGWIRPPTQRRLRPGMFVAQIVGQSMEPLIPDGAWCLFASPVEGSRQGKIALVEHHDISDPDTGGSYTVKRYESQKIHDASGLWRHTLIRLVPVNPDYDPIVITEATEGELKVIAAMLEVLDIDELPKI